MNDSLIVHLFLLIIFFANKIIWTQNIVSGKMIGLPDEFLTNKKGSKGGGVIQVYQGRTVPKLRSGKFLIL